MVRMGEQSTSLVLVVGSEIAVHTRVKEAGLKTGIANYYH